MTPVTLLGGTLASLRQHPLRSILSVLGLVIGVAALVAILSLADGMERFAREEIGTTTDLQNFTIAPRTSETLDGVTIRRGEIAAPTRAQADALRAHLGTRAAAALVQERSEEVVLDTARTAARLFAVESEMWSVRDVTVRSGRLLTRDDVDSARPVVVLTATLAERLFPPSGDVVGRRVRVGDVEAEVVGVLEDGRAGVLGPLSVFLSSPERSPPSYQLRAARAEEVEQVARQAEAWLEANDPAGSGAYAVITQEARARQIRQAMLLFKLVFGLITGISVIVGGVGVMNVLLVTVTERTREIGIRKAVGARRRDVMAQFLAEALAVAGAGSVLGLALGLAAVFALIPVIRHVTEVSLHAALTLQTLGVVAVVALAVGLLFGTYPAARAAGMSPVDAMRHE